MSDMYTEEVDDFLKHFGVKGMKWGVIHDDPKSGSDTSSSQASSLKREKGPIPLNAEDKKVVQQLGLSTGHVANELMRKKYGPPDPDTPPPAPPKKGLTPGQKEALFYGAIGVGLVGYIAFAAYKGNKELTLSGENLPSFKKFLNGSNTVKTKAFDPLKLSTSPITIKAGDIVRRVSMSEEKIIRPGGFFAAYKPEDITRYKAALPVYWKQWGYNASEGYVNNYKALQDVKAPSAKGTYDLIASFLKEETVGGVPAKQYLMDNHKFDMVMVGKNYNHEPDLISFFSTLWAQQPDGREMPVAKTFFDYAKTKGYNALVDINDAGSLGEEPLRFIDSSIFKIVGSDKLTVEGIRTAREVVTAIAHAMGFDNIDDFLMHFGVKGMRWGQRKTPSSAKLAYVSAKADRKDLKELTKTSYRGVVADRKAIRNKIKERAKTDPEYAAALKKIDKQTNDRATAVVLSTTLGLIAAPIVIERYGPTVISAGIRGASNASKSYSESHFASRVHRGTKYNPKSPFWDGVNVAGSVVNMSAELVRRYP